MSTSIVNAQLLHTSYAWVHPDGTGADWGRVDADQLGLSPWYRLFECSDARWIFVAAGTAAEREAFVATVGPDEIISDETGPDSDEIATTLAARVREQPAAKWFEVLDAVGVPVEIVDEEFCRHLFDDPIARQSDLVAETTAGSVGRFEDPGLLVNLSATPPIVQRGPCMCGEHTRVLLLECGYSDAEVDELVDAGVLLDAPVPEKP